MRKLRDIMVGGTRYALYECREDEKPLESGTEGFCDYDKCTIYVVKTSHDRQVATLIHELLHATLDAAGVASVLGEHTKDGTDLFHLDEQIVRAISPVLRGALLSAGWKEPHRTLKKSTRRAKKPTE